MSEKDFDALFSDKLNEESNYPNKDKVKRAVFSQLDKTPTFGGYSNRILSTGWLLLLLLSFIGWNAYQMFEIRHLKTDNQNLKTTVQNLTTASAPLNQRDTIYKTTTIYQTDTIYKRIYIKEQAVLKNKPGAFQENSLQSILYEPKFDKLNKQNKTPSVLEDKIKETITKTTVSTINPDTNTHTPIVNLNKNTDKNTDKNAAIMQGDSLKIALNADTVTRQLNVSVEKKDSLLTQNSVEIEKNQPDSATHIAINQPQKMLKDSIEQAHSMDSLFSHTLIPATPPITKVRHWGDMHLGIQSGAATFVPSIEGLHASRWLGFSGDYTFKDKWRFSISADWSFLKFKSFNKIEALQIPEIAAPNSQYIFKYVEGIQNAGYFGLGVQYTLRSKGWLRPYVSGGYFYKWIPAFEAEYEFIDINTKEEYHLNKTIPQSKSHISYVGFGGEIPIYKRFKARLQLDYGLNFNNQNAKNNVLLLRGGIFYRL